MASAAEVDALQRRLATDTVFWAEQCAVVRREDKKAVPLIARPWQLTFDRALEAQRADGRPMRAIILKARKLGFCLAPYTRVLTADLRWVTIDSVQSGDRLVGCDEFPAGGGGNARRMRVSTVEAVRYVHEVAYRVRLDNGAEFVATGQHRFLSRWGARTEARWREVEKMRVGDRIRHVAQPWGEPEYEDGWLAGMLDGEGSLPYKNGSWPAIVSIERLGARSMVDLQTDHKTFVAEGLVSHNSTWVQAKAMQRITQLEAQYAVIVGQDKPTAGVLFDMAKLIYDRLPTDPLLADMIYGEGTTRPAPFSVKPQWVGGGETRNGSRWMSLGDKDRPSDASIYETRTAGSGSAGRGYTPSIIHASEVAHWEDPRFKIGLMESLPVLPETIAVFESTANGFNDFHTMWQRAVEGREDEEFGGYYVPLFFGWQDNPDYARQFGSGQARERFERTIGDSDGGGDDEEVELFETFGVTLEQLFWRRTKLNEPQMNGDVDIFHQEYPATPEQAFIGSGRPVFPGILVAKAIREAEDAPRPVEGVLRGFDWKERRTRASRIMVPQRVAWVPRDAMTGDPWLFGADLSDTSVWPSERLLVWQHPLNETTQAGLAMEKRRPDGQYVVFCDVAIGQGGTAGDGDWHAVQVKDHITRRQVARYRSRIPVHDLPLVLYLIASYFNEAWLAVEVNGPGQGVVDALVADYGYPRMYRRHRSGDDQRQDSREFLIGWHTSQPSKYLLEQTFGPALREGWHGIQDPMTAREFSTYVQDPKNPAKHGAQLGAHDDLVMAEMGAHRIAAELQPRREKKKGKQPWNPRDPLLGY